jgi:hypothetical protein
MVIHTSAIFAAIAGEADSGIYRTTISRLPSNRAGIEARTLPRFARATRRKIHLNLFAG